MHILFVEASSGGVVGGSLTGLYHLIRGLDRAQFTTSMALYEAKTIDADLRAAGCRLHRIPRTRVPKQHALQGRGGYERAKAIGPIGAALHWGRRTMRLAVEEWPAALALALVIRAERPAVMHLGNGVRANFDGLLAARLTRTPVVCHVKGFEKYGVREQRAARRIDALVCMTEAIRSHCERHGVIAQGTHVVYDAIDEHDFQPQRSVADMRAALAVGDAPAVGIIGNIQEWKGQAVVVEAMARVRYAVPGAVCLIVGGAHRAGAEYEAALRRRVSELGLDTAVRFTGFRTDVPDVINALDVVVHASVRPEPFGRVILEGMLLGKPVIAAAAGGVPELITDGETGFLVPPGDADTLATRLSTLLADPILRAQLGTRAHAWARARFGLPQHVSAMTEIYRNLARLN